MSSHPDPHPFPFNERLRELYGAQEAHDPAATPPAHIWAGIQPRLTPPPAAPARYRGPLLAGVGGLLLGLLLMWWLPQASVTPPVTPIEGSTASLADSEMGPEASTASSVASEKVAVASTTSSVASTASSVASATLVGASAPSAGHALASPVVPAKGDVRLAAAPAAPAVVIAAGTPPSAPAPVVLLPLVQAETAYGALAAADSAAETRAARRRAMLAERAALAALVRRADSLLLTLPVVPPGPPASATVSDTVAPGPFRRWSVALALAPERNFFGLGAPTADTLSAARRVHEQGRAGYNAALLAEYRVDHRLSVGAGLGVASYGAELRLTDRRTHVSTRLDSSITRSATVTTIIRDAYSVRTVRDSILAPILNANQQVIGYQYLPTTRLDTVWTRIENTQVDSITKKTYTPVITTRQEVSARILRPNYRFLTVPLLVRYRLGRATDWATSPTAPRWWADVAVGAQLQFFLGGTQATTLDGRTYQTERVGPRGGPFRPFNVALTGAVAFNYALTPRLSASLAPTLRWQVESVYKPSTNLTQRPTATGVQVALRYAF